MTDRPLSGFTHSQNGQALRYKRRSSVYSRRTTDGVISLAVKPPTGAQVVPLSSPSPNNLVNKAHKPQSTAVGIDFIPVRRKPLVPAVQRPQHKQIALSSEPTQDSAAKKSMKQRLFSKSSALAGMAMVVFILGLGVSVNSLLTNRNVTQQVQAMSSGKKNTSDDGTSGNEKPDESDIHPNAVSSYKVAPDLPRKITIKKIDVAARVKPLGVSRDNQLLAPSSIYDAGWYNASAKPGIDAGAVLIDGHVHGPTKPGIFVNLKKLVSGDIIEVERGDGKVVKYRVEKTAQESADSLNMATLMKSAKPGKQGLNLVTCGGKYDTKTGHYESRDEVFAVQVD